MINLLPQKNKKEMEKDILRRFIVVGGVGFSGLVLVVIVLASVLYSHVNILAKGFEDRLEVTKNLAVIKNLEELEIEVKEINMFTSVLRQGEESAELVTDDIGKVLSMQPQSIKLDGFLFERGDKKQSQPSKMMVSGNALTRKNLLDFINDLKLSGQFVSITSPVSNLLEERDIDFTLSVELK